MSSVQIANNINDDLANTAVRSEPAAAKRKGNFPDRVTYAAALFSNEIICYSLAPGT